VSESDILEASPSEVTSLSIWEINYLMSKILVEQVMTRDVITVDVDTPIEEAARIMADKKIGSLPVTREDSLVGMITETTLFRIFLEMFAAREPGVRISALMRNVPGTLAKVTRAIYEAGGNIIALGTFEGENTELAGVVLKVNGIDSSKCENAIKAVVEKVIDIRETTAG
jgi:acetoin utilization protein AcuB